MKDKLEKTKTGDMRVALINPPIDFNTALGSAKNIGKYTVMIPQGLASIAAVLRAGGISSIIVDAYAENMSIDKIMDRINDYGASIVGISVVTPVAPISYAMAKRIKERNPSIYVVLGGPHPSILPEEALSDNNVDFVVREEGEETFLSLVRLLAKKCSVAGLDGISYRDGQKIIHNKAAGYIMDLDKLPMPAYDMLPMYLYTSPPQWSVASPSYQMLASRGCPYSCGFCYVGMGKRVRYKSAKTVCDEIEYLIENYKCKQIVFADTTFPFNTAHSDKICNEIIRRGLNKKIVWFTSTRADIVNQKMLDLMRRAGCRLITLGVESGNQEILDFNRKGITLEQIEKAVEMASKARIDITASYVLGLPHDNHQTILNTIDFAKKLNTLFGQFNIIVPYPGTFVYEYAESKGLLRNKDWNNYVSITSMTELEPPFIEAGLTKEELLKLQKKAYNSFYLRPSLILRQLKNALFNFDLKKYITLGKVLLETFK